ncbi:hypothetical protein C4K09_3995 [Pseudomonas chlororaphis subsp. aureofaciens]|nr:hypothetical protein C4K09_3995 [Pseudomonas chlororaphis subsp. aureofaciens]
MRWPVYGAAPPVAAFASGYRYGHRVAAAEPWRGCDRQRSCRNP